MQPGDHLPESPNSQAAALRESILIRRQRQKGVGMEQARKIAGAVVRNRAGRQTTVGLRGKPHRQIVLQRFVEHHVFFQHGKFLWNRRQLHAGVQKTAARTGSST